MNEWRRVWQTRVCRLPTFLALCRVSVVVEREKKSLKEDGKTTANQRGSTSAGRRLVRSSTSVWRMRIATMIIFNNTQMQCVLVYVEYCTLSCRVAEEEVQVRAKILL